MEFVRQFSILLFGALNLSAAMHEVKAGPGGFGSLEAAQNMTSIM